MALPNTYNRLDYIQSSGSQYINMGFTSANTITKNLRLTVDMLNLAPSWWQVNGVSGNNGAYVGLNGTTIYYGDGIANQNTGVSITSGHRIKYDLDFLNNYYKVYDITNDTQLLDLVLRGSEARQRGSVNYTLFGYGGSERYSARLYNAQVYLNDVQIRNFIPAKRKSDNVVGLYDDVNDVFYTNAGSGSFTYGSIVYEVNATENPTDSGTITGTGTYPSGNTASLLANANSGYILDYWEVSEEISSNSYVLDTSNLSVYGTTNNWFQATFEKPSLITQYSGNNVSDGSYSRSWDMTIKGSNDGSTWVDIQTNSMTATGTNTITVNNSTPYLYYRWYFSRYNNTFSNGRYLFSNIKIYGLTDYTSTDNPLSLVVNSNINAIANFKLNYQITLTYDSALGSASYSWVSGTQIELVATPNSIAQFKGWYINSIPISTNATYTYTVLSDVTIEARFERVWDITTNVSGNGSIQFTRGTDRNDVVFSVIADTNNHFVKYVVDGVEYTTTPLTLYLTQDTTITAYFEENERYHITVNSNFPYGSFYISDNDVFAGTIITVWARPFPDYNFVRWQDGTLENPRQIEVNSDITLVAEYQRSFERNGIYQYRCYVKDQLDLEAPPKAFMRVDNFDIKRDTMTKSNSTIYVMDTATNVNNGDVLVLYDPMGTNLYEGVVKSMEGNKIICSQMPSFYKGLWIYNVSPQDYLEHEIAVLLQAYANGQIYRSSYTDTLVAQRLGGITINYVGSTAVNLPTDLDDNGNEKLTQKDMEQWIYELYENYGIIFDFQINMAGANYVTIRTPSYETIKVGNNMYAIQDMSPITEIEETNRLIIFSSKKVYRTTYVATKNGVVEQPTSTNNRFDITNTKVVFSDDDVDTLIANNLPEQMYNHKLTFTLIIKNFLYEFGDFNLGGEIDVWVNDDYYNTVLTGYQIKKASNQNITEVGFTCGKVRVALTKKLTMGVVL